MGQTNSVDTNNTNKQRVNAFLPGDLVQLEISPTDLPPTHVQFNNEMYHHTYVVTSIQQDLFSAAKSVNQSQALHQQQQVQLMPRSPQPQHYQQQQTFPQQQQQFYSQNQYTGYGYVQPNWAMPSSPVTSHQIYPRINNNQSYGTQVYPAQEIPQQNQQQYYQPQYVTGYHQQPVAHSDMNTTPSIYPQVYPRVSNPSTFNFQPRQHDCITIQSVIDHRVLYCHPNTLRLIDNESNKRRRIEYALVQQYLHVCRSISLQPLNAILDVYSEHIRKGEPVTMLDLSQKSIVDAQMYPIMQLLKTGSAVRRLDLSFNRLSEYGCLCIGEHLGKLKALRELDLSHNFLNAKSGQHLAKGLKVNKSLNLLNLNHTNLSTEGCDYILDALLANPACAMIKLDLRYNGVGDRQVAALLQIAKKHRSLSFVDIYPAKSKPTVKDDGFVSVNKESDEGGWLSYDGWVNHSHLKDTLVENAQFLKEHPNHLKQISTKSDEISELDDLLRYFVSNLSILKNEYLAPMVSTKPQQTSSQQPAKKKSPEEDWIVLTENVSPVSPFPDNLTYDPDLLSIYRKDRVTEVASCSEEKGEVQEDNEPKVECRICMEEQRVADIYILDCDHKFCLNCLQQYISVKINNGEVDSIKCPDCKRPLSITEIKQLSQNLPSKDTYTGKSNGKQSEKQAQQDLFEKFDRISLQKALSQMGDLVYCPNPSCGNAMIVNDQTTSETRQKFSHRRTQSKEAEQSSSPTNSTGMLSTSAPSRSLSPVTPPPISPKIQEAFTKRVVCTHCRHRFCRLCKKEWHEGLTCQENEAKQKDVQEEQFKQWMEETGASNVKNCPKCNITILKNRGCNSMKCANCQQCFCWFCGEMFNAEDEKKHFRNCTRWSFWGINISLY